MIGQDAAISNGKYEEWLIVMKQTGFRMNNRIQRVTNSTHVDFVISHMALLFHKNPILQM